MHQSQNITRKAAKTKRSYEKFVRLTLMKLTAGVFSEFEMFSQIRKEER